MSHEEVRSATIGTLGFASLVFVAAAYPIVLPWVFLAFFAVFIPLRIFDFWARGEPPGYNLLFLLDFCYLVNFAVAAYFVAYHYQTRWDPEDLVRLDGERFSKRKFLKALLKKIVLMDRVGMALYALADGPVAMALVAWANAWAFHSQEHITSVLIHLLPGLAMFSWMHLPRVDWASLKSCSSLLKDAETTLTFAHCATLSSAPIERPHTQEDIAMWIIFVPMCVYAVWQAAYLIVVEVLLAGYVKRHAGALDTSFLCLRRRERRKGDASVWNRLVFTGSRLRQVALFTCVQTAFTLASLLVFVPSYLYWWVALAFQCVKFAIPLHFGAEYTYVRRPEMERLADRRVQTRQADREKRR
jgi:hypothetical protein